MIKKVYTSNAPEAIGPYSQAIICGNMLFTSGQIPINPATGDVEAEGITDQATQVMKNLSAVLAEAGTSFDKVKRQPVSSAIWPILQPSTLYMPSTSQASPHALV